MAAVQVLAMVIALTGVAVAGDDVLTTQVWLWPVMVAGWAVLRTLTASEAVALTTLVLDSLGTALFLGGTGGPGSPFLPVALAGIWWAACSERWTMGRVYRITRHADRIRPLPATEPRVLPERAAYLAYGGSLAIGYVAFVGLPALQAATGAEALEDAAVMAATWALAGLVRARQGKL